MKQYDIKFRDGSVFEGGSLEHSKWELIPKDKRIAYIHHLLPSGDYLSLCDYDKYYRYCEVTKDIYGGNQGKINIESIFLLGKRGNKINQFRIDLKTGSVDKKELHEQDCKVNPEFWR